MTEVDALSLDAAWERARALETERDQALASRDAAKTHYDRLSDRHSRLIAGLYQVIEKHRGDPATSTIRDELRTLIWKRGGGGGDE